MAKLGLGLTVLVVVAAVAFVVLRPDFSGSPTTLAPAPTQISQSEASGSYQIYTPQAFAAATSTRRVLFFYANWCPTCRPADIQFRDQESEIPPDVTVLRVNYNDPDTDSAERDLAAAYGVTYQHTFVQIDATGQEIVKWNGGGLTELLANVQ